MVDISVGIEIERLVVSFILGVMYSPNGQKDHGTFGDEHSFVPVILRGAARYARSDTIQ